MRERNPGRGCRDLETTDMDGKEIARQECMYRRTKSGRMIWTGAQRRRSVELKTDRGSRYRIDLSKVNYAEWIAPLVRAGTPLARSGRPAKKVAARRSAATSRTKSAYQKLSARDRTAVRAYLGRGTSRGHIANAEVETWIASGKPKALGNGKAGARR